jgi:hypothetical protein
MVSSLRFSCILRFPRSNAPLLFCVTRRDTSQNLQCSRGVWDPDCRGLGLLELSAGAAGHLLLYRHRARPENDIWRRESAVGICRNMAIAVSHHHSAASHGSGLSHGSGYTSGWSQGILGKWPGFSEVGKKLFRSAAWIEGKCKGKCKGDHTFEAGSTIMYRLLPTSLNIPRDALVLLSQ